MNLLRPRAIRAAYNCFDATVEEDRKDPRVVVESALDQSLHLLDFTLIHLLLRPHPNYCAREVRISTITLSALCLCRL